MEVRIKNNTKVLASFAMEVPSPPTNRGSWHMAPCGHVGCNLIKFACINVIKINSPHIIYFQDIVINKSFVKIFLKLIANQCLRALINMTICLYITTKW